MSDEQRTCPQCGRAGPVATMFGYRKMKPWHAHVREQAWCMRCRSEQTRQRRKGPANPLQEDMFGGEG